ncbi:MAG: hypothetical protein AB8B99_17225 [Phormidesmis sp.]
MVKKTSKKSIPDDTISFLVKVVVLSAALSCLIKYGGALLPFTAPFTASLNGLVTAVVLFPSLLIGAALLIQIQRS